MTHVTFLTDAVTCRRPASEGMVTERTMRGTECEGRQQQGREDFLGPRLQQTRELFHIKAAAGLLEKRSFERHGIIYLTLSAILKSKKYNYRSVTSSNKLTRKTRAN